MSEWQDISSRPKSGMFSVGVWVESSDGASRRWSSWTINLDDPAWPKDELGCDGEWGDPPTHWAPLPQPPSSQEKSNG